MVMSGVNCYYEANDKAPVKFKQKKFPISFFRVADVAAGQAGIFLISSWLVKS